MDNNIKDFIENKKSLLVAPAGYGKTFTIVQCVKSLKNKNLILTHTHAGVAAIKNALKEQKIEKDYYEITTITSYAQKYVKAYCMEEFPELTDSNNYWNFVLTKAESILRNTHIKDVIKKSYSQLFVDEYQDCTTLQHKIILAIAESIPVHILGDSLQGIMDFNHDNDRLIDFYNEDLTDFKKVETLAIPYRWYKEGNNNKLGDYLKNVRELLLENIENNKQNNIDLNNNPNNAFYFIKTEGDAYSYNEINKNTNIRKKNSLEYYTYAELLRNILQNPNNDSALESLLLISQTPPRRDKKSVEIRAELKSRLYYPQLYLLEAIDEPSLYEIAKNANAVIQDGLKTNLQILRDKFLNNIFAKSEVEKWINNSYKLVKKEKEEDKPIYTQLQKNIENFRLVPNGINLNNIMNIFYNVIKLKCQRTDFFYSIQNALIYAEDGKTIYETMIAQRNKIRQVGRKIDGKCIGTTALTKGLEFDTVVILDAHNIKNPKDLYVAMTRACKKLIIFSKDSIISPYRKRKK